MRIAVVALALSFAAPQVATFVKCCCAFCPQEGAMAVQAPDEGGC
jgi:hypothetical protein